MAYRARRSGQVSVNGLLMASCMADLLESAVAYSAGKRAELIVHSVYMSLQIGRNRSHGMDIEWNVKKLAS